MIKICNQYKIIKVIGRGKQAALVYLCEKEQKEFAVKKIDLEKVGTIFDDNQINFLRGLNH